MNLPSNFPNGPTRRPSRPPVAPPPQRRAQPRRVARKGEWVERDVVLESALERADRAVQMVEQMRQTVHRDNRRSAIVRSIDNSSSKRSSAKSAVTTIYFANFAILIAIFFKGAGPGTLDFGVLLTTIARVGALGGTYLILVQLLLIARIPFLDRIYGHDGLVRIHTKNGHVAFNLIVIHAYGVVVGRMLINDVTFLQQMKATLAIPYMVAAIVGTLMMFAAIATSIRAARKKLKHEHWFNVHKMTYLGVALSMGHILNGPDFKGEPVSQAYIWMLYGFTFGTLAITRFAIPIRRIFTHQLRVAKVVDEGAGVTSIYMAGQSLDKLQAKAGQFCYWRFLTAHDWREAHPYSLSAAPNEKFLRITVKTLGDASARMKEMPVGTWVTFEGPFGVFTHDARTRVKTVLIAGGVGITPVRSLLEGMPTAPGDMDVIYRADKVQDAVLLHELEDIAARRGARLHVVLGKRDSYPADEQPLSPNHLRRIIPDIARRDVFICASPGMTAGVRASLRAMGLRSGQVHHETFA